MSSANRQRFLALWFPHLPAERLMRRRFGRSWHSQRPTNQPPLIFSQRESNTLRVAALDARAVELGLRPGLGVAEARAMFPALEVIESDPEGDRRLLESLADWCDRYTPLVALDGEEGLFLDITGCAHLFGGEAAMLADVLARFRAQGFSARGAIASTPGAAWAAARYGAEDAPIVSRGAESELIMPMPLAALRLEASVRAGLESVGLRVAGALLAAPRAPLVRRFGRSVTLRLDQALGHIEEAISPRLPIPVLMIERHFFEPISILADIEELTGLLARQLKIDLERRGEGADRLQLQLFRVDGKVARVDIAASRPLRDPRLIQKLFHERLAVAAPNLDAGFGFDLVRLVAQSTSRFTEDQASLEAASADRDGDLAMFADRVRIRLGENAVTQPVLVESHLPERAARAQPFARQSTPRRTGTGRSPLRLREPQTREAGVKAEQKLNRPIRLFDHPEQIEITAAEIPEGPPSHFRWRHVLYRVAASEGPERVAPEWWTRGAPEVDEPDPEKRGQAQREAGIAQTAGLTRDYFRVEDVAGRRFWLFREGLYGFETPPRWFVQGLFA